MNGDRALRVAIGFAGGSVRSSPERICRTCSNLLQLSGAGITLMSGANRGPVCASNRRVAELDQLQFTLGEGPSRDAFGNGIAVSEPDPCHSPTWPRTSWNAGFVSRPTTAQTESDSMTRDTKDSDQ